MVLTPSEYQSLDCRIDALARQMDELLVHFRTVATTPSPPDDVPADFAAHEVADYYDDHLATAPSPPDDVPADFFSVDDDSICLVANVVDCCFVQGNELSCFLGATLIHWNDSIGAHDKLPWILGDHMVDRITRPVARDKLQRDK